MRGRLDDICDGEILCWRACYKTQEWDDLHATCEASDKPLKSEMDGLLNMNHLELSQRTADERSVSVWSTHLNSLWWNWFDISVLHIKSLRFIVREIAGRCRGILAAWNSINVWMCCNMPIIITLIYCVNVNLHSFFRCSFWTGSYRDSYYVRCTSWGALMGVLQLCNEYEFIFIVSIYGIL